RGVPEPVEMYQLDAVPGRTFAALRLYREAAELDDNGDATSSSDEASASTAMSSVSHTIVSLLALLFGTFVAPQRLKVLRPLCERWGVSVPCGVRRAGREEEACRVAMERLAAKMGRVMRKSACKLPSEGKPRKESLQPISVCRSGDALHLFNAAVERGGGLGGRLSHSGLWRASLSPTEEACSATDGSNVTIHVRRPE
ncbi:receptor-type adenylate cyclase, partial [Trypanosoma rangeli]